MRPFPTKRKLCQTNLNPHSVYELIRLFATNVLNKSALVVRCSFRSSSRLFEPNQHINLVNKLGDTTGGSVEINGRCFSCIIIKFTNTLNLCTMPTLTLVGFWVDGDYHLYRINMTMAGGYNCIVRIACEVLWRVNATPQWRNDRPCHGSRRWSTCQWVSFSLNRLPWSRAQLFTF